MEHHGAGGDLQTDLIHKLQSWGVTFDKAKEQGLLRTEEGEEEDDAYTEIQKELGEAEPADIR